jgi:hypothetical protein
MQCPGSPVLHRIQWTTTPSKAVSGIARITRRLQGLGLRLAQLRDHHHDGCHETGNMFEQGSHGP